MSELERSLHVAVPRRRLLRFGAALPALAALAACQLPGKGPPPREFRLTPKSTFPEDVPTVDWSLIVEEPNAAESIDTTRIARVSADGLELEYYADSTWAERPAAMIQTLLIKSFQNSGRIKVVVDDRSGVRADLVLRSELRAFQGMQKAGAPPDVRVAMTGMLIQMPKRNVVGTTEIDRTVPATAGDLPAIVAAFDEALGKVLKRLVEWTLVTGQSAMASNYPDPLATRLAALEP